MSNYNGQIFFKNKNSNESVIIDLNSGKITLENTVTAGTITIRGVGQVINNSVGATVDTTFLLNPSTITDSILDAQTSEHLISGSIGEAIVNSGLTTEQAKQLLLIFVNSL